MKIPFEKLSQMGVSFIKQRGGIAEYRLDINGLKILLAENHSAPVAVFEIIYHVGSRNEGAGSSGLTHFLEHMKFKGTKLRDPRLGTGIDDLLKPVGAEYNATTSADRTNYFTVVPSDKLELPIEIWADTMRNLLLRQEDKDSEMTVVRNEMERGENSPDSKLYRSLYAAAFMEHGYHIPTIGYLSDVEASPVEVLRQFYDLYYWPNNATALVSGDFDPLHALELVVKHFSAIPRSPHKIPQVYTREPVQEGERRFELRRPGDLPRVFMAFHVPQATHEDTYALSALRAILGGSSPRSSRLSKKLVDKGLAPEVFTIHATQHDPGLFIIGAMAAPGVKVSKVERVILKELARLAAKPVSQAELKRAKQSNRKHTILETTDPMGKAQAIAEAEAVADWEWMEEFDDKFDAVTPADVQRVAAKYFSKDNRTVGVFLPKDEQESEAQANSAAQVATSGTEGCSEAGESATNASFASRTTRTVLPNGLTVLIMPAAGTGSVAVTGKVRAGAYFSPRDKSMVASLTGNLLSMGSANRSKTEVAETLEGMGVDHFDFGSDNFTLNFNATVVSSDLSNFLDLLSDLLCNPSFDAEELDKAKLEMQANLQQAASDTGENARQKLFETLYPADCVYHDEPFDYLLKQLPTISVDDLRAFHKEFYTPQGAVLCVVGDVDAAQALELVKASFGDWTGSQRKEFAIPAVSQPAAAQRINVPIAGKKNADIRIGLPASLRRSDPEFVAARIANNALGLDTLSSRLGVVVREKNGLTYGIYSTFSDIKFGGAPWTIQLSVNPKVIDKALALVADVVNDYRANGITDKELADEIGRASGSFQVALRTPAGMAAQLCSLELMGMDVSAMDAYVPQLKAVTKDQVNAAIRKYFDLDHAVTVVAGTLPRAK